jgi:pilus assembly protein CpaB
MKKKRSGVLWMGAGVILAILAALLTVRILGDVAPVGAASAQGGETAPVVVAHRDVSLRTVLSAEDVALRQMPVDLVPVGAATTLDQVLGKVSKSDLVLGEVVLSDRLADPSLKGQDVTFTMPEDKILIALPANDQMSGTGLLQPGVKVDILYSLDVQGSSTSETASGALATLSALQNQEIQAVVVDNAGADAEAALGAVSQTGSMSQAEPTILLAVDPQDALLLKYLRDAGGIMDYALRAPTNQQLLRTEAVTERYVTDRYEIDVESGSAGLLGIALDWAPSEAESQGP